MPTELLRRVDVLVANLPELAALTGGGAPHTLEEVARRGRDLADGGAVVVTLGERGALIVDAEGDTHVPAPAVDAIDTTGAGNASAEAWPRSSPAAGRWSNAVRDAVHVGALSTTRRGRWRPSQAATRSARRWLWLSGRGRRPHRHRR